MDVLHYNLLLILCLLFVIFILCILSQKLRISYPVLLVIGGLFISLIPRIPHIAIDPELIFLIILPPLLYEAAWNTSWHHFWKRRRTISLLAFGLVVFTSVIIAYISHALIPGFTLALGFLLGGIIAPTDAISAVSILKDKKVPKRIQTILEGESLVNDASSLIIFRFAMVAVISGQFSLKHAANEFLWATGLGIIVGIVIAETLYLLYRLLPDIPVIDTSLTLMTPYIIYVSAEYFKVSGVMAVVSGGLFLSYRSHRFLNFESRTHSNSVWSTVSFILNGSVFLLIGLQVPVIIEQLDAKEILDDSIFYGIIISLITVIIRFSGVFSSIFLPRVLIRWIRQKENNPGWQSASLISWAGMRGVVSLASALSLPLTLGDGSVFPHRNMILLITFMVILFTLIVQGLTLPVVIKKLKVKEFDNDLTETEQEISVWIQLSESSLDLLNTKYAGEVERSHQFRKLKKQYETMSYRKNYEQDEDETQSSKQVYYDALLEIITTQRRVLRDIRKKMTIDNELIRKFEEELDIEEAKVRIYISHSKLTALL